jgi:hypothetical protein
MLKTPQDYWKDVEDQLPHVELIHDVLRLSFYYGMAAVLDFIGQLATVEDRGAAFKAFSDQLDMQRILEKARREMEKDNAHT